ncbi:MAG TPA: GNAT family N-acetyltransferase [Candidatus Acidoferrales bacterium]|nr:GNAT family N-acetyltransferase [Candidatus Acidoferrales bacterium]
MRRPWPQRIAKGFSQPGIGSAALYGVAEWPRLMSLFTYREATESDIPAMARIRAAEWETEEYWLRRISAYLQGKHDPQKALKPRISYVAIESDFIVGFIAGHLTVRHSCNGELEWLNVIPEQRGSEVATALLHLLAGWFVAQKALRICVDVQPSNIRARRFYKRHGAEDLNPHWLVWSDIKVVLGRDSALGAGPKG